jgi:uncharacterized membrane protein YphA (DoxX/SURF4 family)
VQGAAYLAGSSDPVARGWVAGIVLGASGIALMIGFLTPFASVAIAVLTLAAAAAWLPGPAGDLLHPRFAQILVAVVAASLAFLGPGAHSVDCRLFGRREIVIPQARPHREP